MKKFLEIPYDQKEYAKLSGAMWDKEKKKWYYDDDITPNSDMIKVREKFELVYFLIPFDQKDTFKNLGCKWDPDRKLWYSYKGNKDFFLMQNYVLPTL